MKKRATEECNYCKQHEEKVRRYEEEVELEKERECLKAYEREKIANGMRCTKEDEIRLQEMQIMQMNERKLIEREGHFNEMMWHQVLMDHVHRQEEGERMAERRRRQEMLERRREYDEQIASANLNRQRAIREEREKENKRLERMKQKMEQDFYNELKRKKDQQMTNRTNFIEGYKLKQTRLNNGKLIERNIDDASIREALEGLRKEKESRIKQIHDLQTEKLVFIENYNRERRIASALDDEVDRAVREWKEKQENINDEYYKRLKHKQQLIKENTAKEYKNHIDIRNSEIMRSKQERDQRMKLVKLNAINELQTKLDHASKELETQIEYRRSLTKQINDNQRYLDVEVADIERKDRPFTKRAVMFNDAMANKFRKSLGRSSTNPVHPFKMLLECQETKSSVQLPKI